MTYDEIKAELYELRESKKEEARIIERIKDIKAHRFDRLDHAIDLSTQYTTKTPGARDDAVIKAIAEADRKIDRLNRQLDKIHARNEALTEKVWQVKGANGLAMYLYFVESKPIRSVSEEMHYSETYAWRLIKRGMETLWQLSQDAQNAV